MEKQQKKRFKLQKRRTKICVVNVDNIAISKLVKTKTNSNYLIGYLDKAIRPLVLIMPNKSGYVKTFKFKEGNNKLMSFRINSEKLLDKYNSVWTKSEDLNCAYKIVNKQMTDYLDGNVFEYQRS